jgi:hypothetical protein
MTLRDDLTADTFAVAERFFEGAPPEQTATLAELRAAMRDTLPTEAILTCWRPGSGDWDWPTEWADIIRIDHTDQPPQPQDPESDTSWRSIPSPLADLIAAIAVNGVATPLLLGDDGRVWDGHHRLLVARLLGIETLTVEYGHSGQETG